MTDVLAALPQDGRAAALAASVTRVSRMTGGASGAATLTLSTLVRERI
jgi:hypothetical protein